MDTYKLIPLTKNKFAKVSTYDIDRIPELTKYKWSFNMYGYAQADILVNGKRKSMKMHRLILKTKFDIDHINGDRLDNRRENLRTSNDTLNAMNRKHRNTNIYGYKGISYAKKDNRWQAEIQIDGVKKYLGYFKTAYEAAKAYNQAAIKYFGVFARLNNLEGGSI